MQRRIFQWMGLIVLFLLFGTCLEGFAKETYTVVRGDTLSGIAKKLGVSKQALRKANGLKGKALKPDQVIAVPQKDAPERTLARKSHAPGSASRYVVKKGDTLARISRKTGVPAEEIKSLNHLHARALKRGTVLILAGRSAAEMPKRSHDGDGARVAGKDRVEEGDDGTITSGAATIPDGDVSGSEELLGSWKNTEERQLFVRVAMGFLGAPYRMGGSSVRGLDCSAFVRKIYELFGVTLPRTAHEQAGVGISVLKEELEAGDLVFFKTRQFLGHVGIYIGNKEFVQASSRNKGVRIDSLEEPYYDRHFVKAVRLKGLDGGI
jgi:peptidoglycan DL-endopeptidase LytE